MSYDPMQQSNNEGNDASWQPPVTSSSGESAVPPNPIEPRYESDYYSGGQYPPPAQPGAVVTHQQQPYDYGPQPGNYPSGTPGTPSYAPQVAPVPYGQYPPYYPFPQKSRAVVAVLAFFFGVFGIHNFYVGRSGIGIAQLLITLLSLFLLSWVSGIWAFVEMILYLVSTNPRWSTDGRGIPLS
ncbi:MAG: TM2 domain-containing protein [Actinomycetaceae bacterium]|nr:TM2 domain-containing protein [Actinomycetaceae bacterium]